MSNLYWDTLFDCGEWVNACGSVREVRCMPLHMARVASHQYVCVNPIQAGKTRKQRNIAEYRNFVVERDDLDTIEEQLEWADSIQLPYSTAVHSGKRSVHFIIALEHCISAEDYREMARALKVVLPGVDKSCLEPSRLTRVPAEGQALLKQRIRVPYQDLKIYCATRGYNFDQARQKEVGRRAKFQETLTRRTMRYLGGQSERAEAHGDSIHAAKNLFEIGHDYQKVLQSMMAARMLYLDEDVVECRQKSEKIVEWVYKEWEICK